MKRGNKYRAKPTVVDGIRFDSKREAKRYGELKLLEAAGEISQLSLQPKFDFVISGKPVLIKSTGFPNGRRAKYTADFMYNQGDTRIVEDSKSPATDTEASRLRRAVAEAIFGIEVKII